MDEFADSSESIDSIGIRTRIPITKDISKGYDYSSTLEQLKKNATELLLYKDKNISLEADLKIAKETIKLHEAELAFQKKEYEAEIKSLKQNLVIMQKGIVSNDTGLIELSYRDQNEDIVKKYVKWKNRSKSIQAENIDLQRQIEQLKYESNLKINQDRNSHTEIKENDCHSTKDLSSHVVNDSDISENQNQYKQEIESLQSQIVQLQKENGQLQIEIKRMQKHEQSKDFEMQAIKTENEGNASSIEEISNQIINAEGENQRLRHKVDLLASKNRHLEKDKNKIQNQRSLIDHIASQFLHLCESLGIESLNLEDDWNPLIAKYEKIPELTNTIDEIKKQNIALQKRLTTVMNDKQSNQSNDFTKCDDGNCEHLLNEMEGLKDRSNRLEKTIHECSFKEQFSNKIINIYSLLVRQIDDMHDSIFGPLSPRLRPVILSVIFAKRFILFSKNPTVNNGGALMIFSGRIILAADSKLAQIKERISSLSYDLMESKKQIAHYSIISKQFEEDNDQTHSELENSSDQLAVAKKKIKYYKSRLIELQEELSTLIPKDLYDSVVEKLSRSKQRNQLLREENANLQNEIEKQKHIQKEIKKDFKQHTWESNQQMQDYDDLREKLMTKSRELETFQVMLSEKNKEVLALERLISREKNKSLSKQYHVFSSKFKPQSLDDFNPNLSHEKNQKHMNNHENKVIAVLDNTATDLASIVNPEFLK